MIRRIWTLIVKEFIHLRRDWWLPAFMVLGGAMELVIISWATSRPITNLPMVVMDQDHTAASRALIVALENTTTFRYQGPMDSLDDLRRVMDKGQVYAGVIIPHGFEAALHDPQRRPTVAAVLNGTESLATTEALNALDGLAQAYDLRLLVQRHPEAAGALTHWTPSVRVWFNESLNRAWYTAPAELGLMLEFTVLLFVLLAFARERELGTLEQLLVMPFSAAEIILGKVTPAIVLSYLDFWLMFGLTHWAFGLPLRGSALLLAGLVLLYLLEEVGKGMVLAVFSRNQHQAFLLIMLVGLTEFMFSGYAVPIESMPRPMQTVATLLPISHWMRILRGVMMKGLGVAQLWPDILTLAAYALVMGTIGALVLRRALD